MIKQLPDTPSKPYIFMFIISMFLCVCFDILGYTKIKKGIAIIAFILILIGIIKEVILIVRNKYNS